MNGFTVIDPTIIPNDADILKIFLCQRDKITWKILWPTNKNRGQFSSSASKSGVFRDSTPSLYVVHLERSPEI